MDLLDQINFDRSVAVVWSRAGAQFMAQAVARYGAAPSAVGTEYCELTDDGQLLLCADVVFGDDDVVRLVLEVPESMWSFRADSVN